MMINRPSFDGIRNENFSNLIILGFWGNDEMMKYQNMGTS